MNDIWDLISGDIKAITKTAPLVKVKVTQSGSVLTKHPWETIGLKRKRRDKEKAWRVFEAQPTNNNLQYALSKGQELEDVARKCMANYEKKMSSGLKSNPKSFYRYVNSKRKIKQSVVSVKNKQGFLAKTAEESANILAEFFESTFHAEPFGPLPAEAYNDCSTVTVGSTSENHTCDPVSYDQVLKLLSELNIYKSYGPDEMHPKVIKSLSVLPDFVRIMQLLFSTCITERCIPEIWKTALAPLSTRRGVRRMPRTTGQ